MSRSDSIINYYRKQAKIYDNSRFFFLFGRGIIAHWIMKESPNAHLLEIGCGTGFFLNKFNKNSNLQLTGIDLSPEMLKIAKKKLGNEVKLLNTDVLSYDPETKFDAILLSYVFTLDLEQTNLMIRKIKELLAENGTLYVLDFHKYGNSLYKKYMNWHGIEMGVQLLEALENNFVTEKRIVKKAYFGTWQYFLFKGANV
jgi:ubiquinone/menaquinone biosynthesis C-methylase UbiE